MVWFMPGDKLFAILVHNPAKAHERVHLVQVSPHLLLQPSKLSDIRIQLHAQQPSFRLQTPQHPIQKVPSSRLPMRRHRACALEELLRHMRPRHHCPLWLVFSLQRKQARYRHRRICEIDLLRPVSILQSLPRHLAPRFKRGGDLYAAHN